MILVLFAVFGVAFLLTLGLVPLARAWARRTGLIDEPGGRKAHERPMPLGGGVAMFLAWCLPLLALLALDRTSVV
jgi:UDP-N-acetylmuramyl pentapeptide phosphotransferase/UDP-N-acetylglucosamine-1-phosphate transferase